MTEKTKLVELPKDATKQIVVIGFLVNLVLTCSIIGIGFYYMNTIHMNLDQIVNVHNVKLGLVNKLNSLVVKRSYVLSQVAFLDEEEQTDMLIAYETQAGRYAHARAQLYKMSASPQERAIFALLDTTILTAQKYDTQAVEDLMWAETVDEIGIALTSTIAPRMVLLENLEKFIQLQVNFIKQANEVANDNYDNARLQMFLWAWVLWYISGTAGYMMMRNGIARNSALITTYNELGVTLNELTEAQQSLKKTNKKLNHANDAKSQFLATMSHELRTPLNAILGFSELIEDDATLDGLKEIAQDSRYIQNAGKHLLGLVNDLLNISKIEAGEMDLYLEDFDLKKLLDEVSILMHPIIVKQKNSLYQEYDNTLGIIHTDRVKLQQILYNLLNNANKFTKKGHIYLQVQLCVYQNRTACHFQIRDTGIGMSQHEMTKLFKPFSQADISTTRKYGGTGLGLAISQHFAVFLGSEINVRSEIAVGSVFEFYLFTESKSKK